MEVLVMASNFHDTDAKWKARRLENEYELLIGSEKDRISIRLTEKEIQQVIRVWLEDVAGVRF